MDEEISIIDNNTRNEKIKNFFINNKKNLIIAILIIIIGLGSYFSLGEVKDRKKIKLANQFNLTIINYKKNIKKKTTSELIDLIEDNIKTNKLFDELINKTNLEKEIKNLIIYKKALFNSNFVSENDLLIILNPIINSESIWKSHALYLLAEYFYANNEVQKAKEFFNQVLVLQNSNIDIKKESQKRLDRDLGE